MLLHAAAAGGHCILGVLQLLYQGGRNVLRPHEADIDGGGQVVEVLIGAVAFFQRVECRVNFQQRGVEVVVLVCRASADYGPGRGQVAIFLRLGHDAVLWDAPAHDLVCLLFHSSHCAVHAFILFSLSGQMHKAAGEAFVPCLFGGQAPVAATLPVTGIL